MSVRKKDDVSRHLDYGAGDNQTICGLDKEVSSRRLIVNMPGFGDHSVHFSKARKTDCETCRRRHRDNIWKERVVGSQRVNDAATATGMYDHD